MDSCRVALGTIYLAKAGKGGGFRNVGNEFLGERIGGSLNNTVFVNQLAKNFRAEKRVSKAKPGVAFAVLTSNDAKEALTLRPPRYERLRADPKNVASVILGGGAGTQLFPLTRRAATPAVPAGGCYKLIDIPMSNCINSGINKIFVFTQFDSASLNRHLARTYYGNGINFGDGFVENILILSGDHLYRMDYTDFVQHRIDSNADITISCAPVGESRASDYGLVQTDSKGRIVHFAEKPKCTELKAMLLRCRYPTSNDFGSEIIPAAVMEQNVQAYIFKDYWEDIGMIKTFYEANLALAKEVPKFESMTQRHPFIRLPNFYNQPKLINAGLWIQLCPTDVSYGNVLYNTVFGERSRLDYGYCHIRGGYYETEAEIASLLAEGKVLKGVGSNTKIREAD